MCLIIVCKPGIRPAQSMLEDAHAVNADGIGVAWNEKRKVHWRKGITNPADTLASVPLDSWAVIHFRLATIGGKDPRLTHPFIVHSDSVLALNGSTAGRVLFHNGHWSGWRDSLVTSLLARAAKRNIVLRAGKKPKLPNGPWSDSRAIAILAAEYGEALFQLLENERIATLGTDGVKTYGTGWSEFHGVMLSNRHAIGAPKKYQWPTYDNGPQTRYYRQLESEHNRLSHD